MPGSPDAHDFSKNGTRLTTPEAATKLNFVVPALPGPGGCDKGKEPANRNEKAMIKRTLLSVVLVAFCCKAVATAPIIVVTSELPSPVEQLAAKEIARYLYLRTGRLSTATSVANATSLAADQIVILRKAHPSAADLGRDLAAQQYRLKTVSEGKRRKLLIVGGDDSGLLYGVYAFLEKIGIRFYLHQDVIPAEKIELTLPVIDETGKPLFQRRGFNPWGGHAEGIDAWDADEWKAVLCR